MTGPTPPIIGCIRRPRAVGYRSRGCRGMSRWVPFAMGDHGALGGAAAAGAISFACVVNLFYTQHLELLDAQSRAGTAENQLKTLKTQVDLKLQEIARGDSPRPEVLPEPAPHPKPSRADPIDNRGDGSHD